MKSSTPPKGCIIVVRHGERLDYITRESSSNWITNNDTPFNPPLTKNGWKQSYLCGQYLSQKFIPENNLKAISQIYSSPLTRCAQTASGIRNGSNYINSSTSSDDDDLSGIGLADLQSICIEYGLMEVMNENWYRSWCLPTSNGTWGGTGEKLPVKNNSKDLHKMAKKPVHELLTDISNSINNELKEDEQMSVITDKSYDSMSIIKEPFDFRWGFYESRKDLPKRMKLTLETLAKRHMNETIVLVTHGGPSSSLYYELKSQYDWRGSHGECGYTCWSVYSYDHDNEMSCLAKNCSAHLQKESNESCV